VPVLAGLLPVPDAVHWKISIAAGISIPAPGQDHEGMMLVRHDWTVLPINCFSSYQLQGRMRHCSLKTCSNVLEVKSENFGPLCLFINIIPFFLLNLPWESKILWCIQYFSWNADGKLKEYLYPSHYFIKRILWLSVCGPWGHNLIQFLKKKDH
jgi:hypothetical protein